ncbi:jg17568, partial [Pararge aegeria aegeria]
AYCAQGSCRTHTDQCRLLWGSTGSSSDVQCYNTSNVKGDKKGNCGYRRDTDKDGAHYYKCASEDAMCGLLQCRHLNERLEYGMETVATLCAAFINNNGHCHCDAGFAPPLCALPGPGGSIDSGPATDSSIQRNFMVAMYVIFLGILPSILLVLFLLYYSRHNVLLWWKKPRKTVQSPKKNSLQRRLSRSASKFAANFQNNPQNNAQPVNVHTLSNPDDMSSSLLRSDSEHSPSGNLNPSVNFFGNFKGFSLTPIEKNPPQGETNDRKAESVPKSAKITPVHRSGSNSQNISQALKPVLRSAPPLPVVPITTKPTNISPSVKRANSSVQNRLKALIVSDKSEEDTIVTNPVPRPVISSPILETSTCTAKELISPLQGSKTLGPIRAAPTVPSFSPDLPKRPLSMHSASNVLQKPLPEEPKKVKEGTTINRIASFLKQEKHKEKERNPVERSHSLPKNANHQVKVLKTADKAALRTLQISNPILQKDIELSVNTVPVVSDSEDGDDSKAFVNRAHSMRAPLAQKPTIQSFGSMRQAPGVPRPLSCVGRPTAPPPPLPNQSTEEPTIYQKPKIKHEVKSTDYVDAIEEKQVPLAHIDEESGDNIYAVIEESPEHHFKPLPKPPKVIQPPVEEYKTPKPINSNSGSTESMGLLGEIVCEIQNRNFDSIYSASTLSRKKEKERKNAESKRDSTYMNTEYKTPESVYSAKSTASTTSSGYLHPSAVNVPTYMQKDDPKQDMEKANSKIPTFTRQVTPPGLRTSTFKSVPQSPKTVPKSLKTMPNSPDLVSSCTVPDAKNVKAPDVLNNNKVEPPKLATKPNTVKIDNRPPLRPAPNVDKKPVKTGPALKAANLTTNVNKADKNPPLNRANSKTDSNVKAIADSLNKNRPKIVPKPSTIQKTDTNIKPNTTKLASKPSNVASLQQKFENRKSLKEISTKK